MRETYTDPSGRMRIRVNRGPSGEENKRAMTCEEIKNLPFWPEIKQVLEGTITETKKAFPACKVELRENPTNFQIVLDGVPEVEIDCLDLSESLKVKQ